MWSCGASFGDGDPTHRAAFGSAVLWMAVWLVPALTLLHHPDPVLSCNSFWGLSRRERCRDNPQKLLKKARIGVMQKNWMKKDTATWLWQCHPVAWAQRVGSPLQFVQRVPVARWVPFARRVESPLPFARRLPVCVSGPVQGWPGLGSVTTARDQRTQPRTQAAAQHRTRWTHLERAPDRLRHCVPGTCHNTRHTPVVSSSSASPRSRPPLTISGGCQGIFPALTTPRNR